MVTAQLLAEASDGNDIFITVAIPHYKHRQYLEIALASIITQTYSKFEILVSNDASPDDSDQIIPPLLASSGCNFQYYSQTQNLGYDGNVRFCLAKARGRYVFLLGNDDALANRETLQQIYDALTALKYPAVAFTNFADWQSKTLTQRALSTKILGNDVETALRFYRSFSFVSGLIYNRELAATFETARWDNSIYYQIYLGTRIVASGQPLASLNILGVLKDIRIDGHTVPNYATKWSSAPISFEERQTGIASVIRVTWDGIQPYIPQNKASSYLRQLLTNVYTTLHPYWILEYRRVANWSFAVGVSRGHQPSKLIPEDSNLTLLDRLWIYVLYLGVTLVGLLLPIVIFNRTKQQITQWLRQRKQQV